MFGWEDEKVGDGKYREIDNLNARKIVGLLDVCLVEAIES